MGELQQIERTSQDAPSPAVIDSAAALIDIIGRAARDPAVDIDKMERLMAMQERIVMRGAETAFNAAMQAAQAEMPAVTRDARNDQTRSRYARLETISAAIKPVITRHGFSLSYGTDASPLDGHYGVTCLVAHSGGFSRVYRADIPTDANGMQGKVNKTATHAFGSTMSYGRRYLLLMVFDIALTNEDDDGQAAGRRAPQRDVPDTGDGFPGTITEEQAMNLRELVIATSANLPKFLAIFRVAALADIPASRHAEAVAILKDRERKRAGR